MGIFSSFTVRIEENRIVYSEKSEGIHNYAVSLPDQLNLNDVVKDFVQMYLKHWQDWGIIHLSGKPVQDHPLSKKMFLDVHIYTASIVQPQLVLERLLTLCNI